MLSASVRQALLLGKLLRLLELPLACRFLAQSVLNGRAARLDELRLEVIQVVVPTGFNQQHSCP